MSDDKDQPPAILRWQIDAAATLQPGALTNATSDVDIVRLWLRRPNLSPLTVRNCRKEADRFLLWIHAQGLGLRDVRYEHLLGYAQFITNPQPAADWVASGKWPRTDPRWRPFLGPLSEISQRQALVNIKALFRWALAAEYLRSNPAQLLTGLNAPTQDEVTRFLPKAAMPLLYAAADALPCHHPTELMRQARARFIVTAYYLSAARLAELASADMGSFHRDRHGKWWLHLMGKGRRKGKVPATAELISALKRYRTAFGLTELPSPGDQTPLLLTTRGPSRRATHHPIARSLKTIFSSAAALARHSSIPDLAEQLERASTHWLRHSSLTHQVDSGAPLKTVQLNARHAKLSTTGLYLHKEDDQRHAETSVAFLNIE